MDLKAHIRNVKDFPKAGIMFRDITTLLINPEAFNYTLEQLFDFTKEKKIKIKKILFHGSFYFSSIKNNNNNNNLRF